MAVQVYGECMNPFTRNVLVTLEMLKMPYELIYVNPCEKETMTPEFLEMNPQSTIPVMKDGDLILNESRAIMVYLANKHGDTELYPKDLKTRARIDQRLYFEMGSYSASGAAVADIVFFSDDKVTDKQVETLKENLVWLNDFIKPTGYVAGTDHVTLADLAFFVGHTTLEATGIIDLSPYTELPAWSERVKAEIPNYEKANGEGIKKFGDFCKTLLGTKEFKMFS